MKTLWYSRIQSLQATFEAWYPWVGGGIMLVAAAMLVPRWHGSSAATGLVDPIMNVAAISIGFLVAVAVMLAPLKSEPVIQELQRIDAFVRLLSYLKSAIYTWGAVIALGLALKAVTPTAIALGSILTPDVAPGLPRIPWFRVLLVLWAASLATGALTGHRIVSILFALLRYRDPRKIRPIPPDPGREDDDDEPMRLPPPRRAAR